MKIIVDIKNESKVNFVMEFFASQNYISTEAYDATTTLSADLQEAMAEVKAHKAGKLKLKTAQELLDEL